MEKITSLTNVRIKRVVRLRDKSAERRHEGVFPAEGERLVSEVPEDRLEELFVTEDWIENWLASEGEARPLTPKWLSEGGKQTGEGQLSMIMKSCSEKGLSEESNLLSEKEEECSGNNRRRREVFRRMELAERSGCLFTVTREIFAKISDTRSPQGVLALVKEKQYSLPEVADHFSRILFLENIRDPGNLGTMLRTAEAAGAALILTKGCADIHQPKVVRASMGAIFRVPAFMTESPEETANRLREQGFRVAAAHLEGNNLYQTELGKKIVFLIGNEGNGLTDSLTACADCLLRIPMEGQVESLNAAMSAGLLVYEAKRQQDAHSN